MEGQLGQSDFDDLSAWLDGELDAGRAGGVANLVRTDPLWRRTHAELVMLSAALDACDVPSAPDDLADKIIAHSRRGGRRSLSARVVRVAVPFAVAASVIVAVTFLVMHTRPRGPDGSDGAGRQIAARPAAKVSQQALTTAEQDKCIVKNLHFFRNYDVLVNYETLEAIDRLETDSTGM